LARLAGAVVGAVAGAVVGKAAAEVINPTVETKYWKENHASRLYADPKLDYDQYGPAYQYGWESFGTRGKGGKTFESVESELGRGWDKARGESRLVWDQARAAVAGCMEQGGAGGPQCGCSCRGLRIR
jgi:hypothetical protein